MKKTLYIQIDNNSLPKSCSEDVEVLDCRCINDFCSIVGDALVSDLKDENGKPYYRLINPVGQLLMDFKTVKEEAFNELISKWYDYLGELLHKGTLDSDMTVKFPHTYIDWLLQNDNPYYESVGKELQKKRGKISISSEDVIDDVMASLTYKISHTLQERKDDISFVVFSNPIIRNSSYVVKRVKIVDMEFLRYDRWREQIVIRQLEEEVKRPKSFVVNGVPFEMIMVEGGTFTMGATPEQGSDAYEVDNPPHKVTLSDFYIGQFTVTQELWTAVMGNNPSRFKGANLPVENVCWDDLGNPELSCQEFIRKLNKLTGKQFRLPTEAEWEYAARGGKLCKGYKYAGSDNLGEVAWYSDDAGSKTHPVGQKKPNELDIYDMSGNVCEWCQDWYGGYSSGNQTNPKGPARGSYRVYRGGSWGDGAWRCRTSCRGSNLPFSSGVDFGFRLAL